MTAELQNRFAQVHADWNAVTTEPNPVPDWENTIAHLRAEQANAVASGTWRTGGRTLMHALGIHEDEVILCRGLGWALKPDGWHGLGTTLLNAVLERIGADPTGSEAAIVVLEEARHDTRADIVIRYAATTVLVEAKVWAEEQPRQCDGLADLWADDNPDMHLVFLTRDGKKPTTDNTSAGRWAPLSWPDIADLLTPLATAPDVAPGVHEYANTLARYGGTRS